MQKTKNSSINISFKSDSDCFKILSDSHKYNKRQPSSYSFFFIPRERTKLGKRKRWYAGPSIWRQVPNNMKSLSKH